MEDLGWGFLMLVGLFVLCISIIIVAFFHAVWLVRLIYSVLNSKPAPAAPFSKKKAERSADL